MKKITFLTIIAFFAVSMIQAQNVADTLYIMKNGSVIDKLNVITDLDSIVFYNPAKDSIIEEGFLGIEPYSKNPFYWQYKGKPILLYGGAKRDNIFLLANEGTELTEYLDLLKSCGANYVRCAMNSREYTEAGIRWGLLPYPYAKIDDKYDLSVWDEEYWDKLKTFLTETQNREIIVQIEVWDRWNESGGSSTGNTGWYSSPWNPNNNVNYDWGDSPLLKTGQTGFYNPFHYAAITNDAVLLPVQKAFINKIIDIVIDNGFDHVLFQVDNASGIGEDESIEPDPYWANYIRTYANSKDQDHPVFVSTSRRFNPPTIYITDEFKEWDNPEIQIPIMDPAFNYCDISQNNGNSGQTQYDNVLWYRSKVQENGARPINNVNCYHFNWPTGISFNGRMRASDDEAISKFWRAIFGGAASLAFHMYTPDGGAIRDGFGISAEAQTQLKSMSMLLGSIDIFSMNPNNSLLSDRSEDEAYCLADPGKQYVVFFTGQADKTIKIDLAKPGEKYNVKWLDIKNNTWHTAGDINGGIQTLSPPGTETHWAVVLTN